MQLPAAYLPVRDILNLEDRRSPKATVIQSYSWASVIGIITDRRDPIPTNRTDWKATIRLIDLSSDENGECASLVVNMFYSEDLLTSMMPLAMCGDVLIVHKAKVQIRGGEVSLVTNAFATTFALFTASKIPKPPNSAASALVKLSQKQHNDVDNKDSSYVSYLRANIDKSNVPGQEDFVERTVQSANVKEKFRELKDVRENVFCDLIVQVVRSPFENGLTTTLWVTDYTTNPDFYDFSDSDDNAQSNGQAAGKCPAGKMSMQISCFDEHTEHINEADITKDDWVSIRNVRVEYSRSKSNLEGKLRGSRDAYKSIKISKLCPADRDDVTPNHKAALQRWRDYKRAKHDKHKLIKDAAEAGRKRKANMPTALAVENTKTKRKAKRAKAQHRASEQAFAEGGKTTSPAADVHEHPNLAAQSTRPQDLNTSVKCENTGPSSTVAMATQRLTAEVAVDEDGHEAITLPMPFVNRKYGMDVRVTDFYPNNLLEFCRRKRTSVKAGQFGLLSDDGYSDMRSDGGEESESDELSDTWEWHFFLELEDASTNVKEPERFWVVVDDHAAQCLLYLDAKDLTEDTNLLGRLHEKLFILWGDLEDQKTAMEAAKVQKTKRGKGFKADTPPPHSDDEFETKVSNRPFSCCIEQYGIPCTEAEFGWKRLFRLTGTRIAY